MRNPFTWLRFVQFILSVCLVLASLLGGRPGGLGVASEDSRGILVTFVGDVSSGAVGDSRESDGSIIEILAELVDTPIRVDTPSGVVGPGTNEEAWPIGGVGGVIGDGVSSAHENVSPAPTPAETRPLATSAPNAIQPTTPTPTAPPPGNVAPSATVTLASTPTVVATDATSTRTPDSEAIRLDDPVLRVLPELRHPSNATGVPVEVVAGVARDESNGDPNLIAVGRGRGLTGVSESELTGQGVPTADWHTAEANLMAGATALAALFSSTGSWTDAAGAYFGTDCDATGVCRGDYVYAVNAWVSFYASALASPARNGLTALPSDWTIPNVAPYEGQSPRPLTLPPGVTPPTETPIPTTAATRTATSEPSPTSTMMPSPSPTPTPSSTPTPTAPPTSTAIPPTDVLFPFRLKQRFLRRSHRRAPHRCHSLRGHAVRCQPIRHGIVCAVRLVMTLEVPCGRCESLVGASKTRTNIFLGMSWLASAGGSRRC